MFKKLFLLTLAAAFLSNLFAQDHKPKWDKWDDDWAQFEVDFGNSPYLELNYGFGTPKLKAYDADFAKTGMVELRLGYRSVDDYYSDYIIKSSDNYTFVQYISTELGSANVNNNSELQVDSWRFGFGNLRGIGYRIGKVSIIPFNEMHFDWSNLDFKNLSPYSLFYFTNNSALDTKPLDIYGDNIRFGTTTAAGLKLEISNSISLNNSYEMSVVYPRHLFWKNAGSLVIEAIGSGFVDFFVDEVMDSTPEAGPILNVLLKGGLNYAFYSLRRENMNWPFGGVNPVTFEHYKIGLTFTF